MDMAAARNPEDEQVVALEFLLAPLSLTIESIT